MKIVSINEKLIKMRGMRIMAERDILLIVDDADINRDMIKDIFEEQFDVLEAADGKEAIQYIARYYKQIALIFLDLIMPVKSGLEVLKYMNETDCIKYIPVIMLTGESTVETDEKAYELGASDVMRKPFEPKVVMRRAKNLIELFENRNHMERKLEKRTRELKKSKEKLEKSNEFLVNALSSVVEFRSMESGEHIQRVKYFTRILLRYLIKFYPEYQLTDEAVDLIVNASALHDLGKIAIRDDILLKPGRLTEDEFKEMQKHTIYGCEILENFKQEDSEFYRYCYDICRYHHERYDGNGYPDHLKGEEIPIWAQVVSIVDVYDALVSKRVYKEAYAVEEAVRMIFDKECGVFSDKILDCFKLAKQEIFRATETKLSFADGNMLK
jgi:putative two-component system response regulator